MDSVTQAFDPIEAVRSSCRQLCQQPPGTLFVTIDNSALDQFASNLAQRVEDLRSLTNNNSNSNSADDSLPFHDPEIEWKNIHFATLEDELSAHATLHLLNIGHGHKRMLKELGLGRYKDGTAGSAFVTMLQGVGRAATSSGGAMTAQRMATWPPSDTCEFFGLPESSQLANQVTTVLKETGVILLNKGFKSLGSLILEMLTNHSANANAPTVTTVNEFVAFLVTLIPAFYDCAEYTLCNGTQITVHIYKKAFMLARDVATRFNSSRQMMQPLLLANVESLTVMADNVLPAVLRSRGVLHLSKEGQDIMQRNDGVIPARSKLEIELRAVSIEACEQIVAAINNNSKEEEGSVNFNKVTAAELDLWLWGVLGKEKGLRSAPRHFCPDTIFY